MVDSDDERQESGVANRFGAWLRVPHLGAWPDVSATDEAAYAEYARSITTAYALVSATSLAACVILWWPLDLIVAPDERFAPAFLRLRVGLLAVLIPIVLAFRHSAWVRGHALPVGVLSYAAVMAVVGYTLGGLSGPEQPWFADAFVGIVPSALMPLALRGRIVGTGIIAGSLALAFFAPFPANRASAFAAGQLSFLVFTAAFTVVTGEVILRTLRRSYFQSRTIDRARAELADANDHLSEQVAARTAELRSLAAHLDSVLESERTRISRELHDELGQELTALRLTLDVVESRYDTRPDALAPLLARLGHLLDRATASARRTVTALRPRAVETLGLAGAIDAQLQRLREAGIQVTAELPPTLSQVPNVVAVQVFRVVQEAVTNVLRHADATRVRATVTATPTEVTLSISDDGCGFDLAVSTAGFGLAGLRERISAAGGTVAVESAPGSGTAVRVVVPIGGIS